MYRNMARLLPSVGTRSSTKWTGGTSALESVLNTWNWRTWSESGNCNGRLVTEFSKAFMEVRVMTVSGYDNLFTNIYKGLTV